MPRAGLAPALVTEAGAMLADAVGFDQLSMGLLADRLGVKTPSLYKHVDSLADLAHRIAVLAMTELGDALRDATQGRAGSDALTAAARAMRTYAKAHAGRYAAGNSARPTSPDDPLIPASNRLLASFSAVLRGYQLDPSQEIHALRMLRSMLHGFATLEMADGFQIDTDIDDSFTWTIKIIDHALQSAHALRRTTDADERSNGTTTGNSAPTGRRPTSRFVKCGINRRRHPHLEALRPQVPLCASVFAVAQLPGSAELRPCPGSHRTAVQQPAGAFPDTRPEPATYLDR